MKWTGRCAGILTVACVCSVTALVAWADPIINDDDGRSFGFGVSEDGRPASPGAPGVNAVWTDTPSCAVVTLIALPEDPAWAGHTPDEGRIVQDVCAQSADSLGDPYFLANGAPPAPDAGLLAQQAFNSIPFPTPVPSMGPDVQLAVNRWLYLWVDDPGALSATAAVPALSVTATATLSSTLWSMGELIAPDQPSRVAPFTCAGAGTRPPPGAETSVAEPHDPGCAYWFRLRSLPERTGGAGTWPVTVASTWTVTWVATNGMSGVATRTQSSAVLNVSVGEWRTVVVAADEQVGPR